MLDKKIIKRNGILFGILGLCSLVFGLAGLGALAILFAGINLLLAIVYLVTEEYKKFKTCLLIGGVLFLIGFGLCSTFTLGNL